MNDYSWVPLVVIILLLVFVSIKVLALLLVAYLIYLIWKQV